METEAVNELKRGVHMLADELRDAFGIDFNRMVDKDCLNQGCPKYNLGPRLNF